MTRLGTIMFVVAISTCKGRKMHQLDMKSAFLNTPLEEEVYVKQPPGFDSKREIRLGI